MTFQRLYSIFSIKNVQMICDNHLKINPSGKIIRVFYTFSYLIIQIYDKLRQLAKRIMTHTNLNFLYSRNTLKFAYNLILISPIKTKNMYYVWTRKKPFMYYETDKYVMMIMKQTWIFGLAIKYSINVIHSPEVWKLLIRLYDMII